MIYFYFDFFFIWGFDFWVFEMYANPNPNQTKLLDVCVCVCFDLLKQQQKTQKNKLCIFLIPRLTQEIGGRIIGIVGGLQIGSKIDDGVDFGD